MSTSTARLCIALLLTASATGCNSTRSETDRATTAVARTAPEETSGTATPPDREPVTLPPLEPSALDDVLPVVCDFERYNGLLVKADATDSNPARYEQSLDVFVRRVFGDRSLPTDETSAAAIAEERARCDALPNLTFANGSHPVGVQIASTVFRTLVPVQADCSWERKDGDGVVIDAVDVEAGSMIEIVVEPTDRSVRIDGCGIFVAGTAPTER